MTYSQYKQDEMVDAILGGKRDGVFIDVGAHNGEALSNSCFFGRERNWTGVCFEPNPFVFDQLIRNRKCKCENIGVSNIDSILKFWKIKGYCEMLSGFVDFYDPEHVKRIERELKEYGGSKEEIQVKVVNFNEYLSQNGIFNIDYCSIDTEGGEMEILKTIDFDNIKIRVLTIENNYDDPALKKFMSDRGYSLRGKAGTDEIYFKNII